MKEKKESMKEVLKKNKRSILVTSLITLLPMAAGLFLWHYLPDPIATHFGSGNIPNGWSSKGFAVFGLPLFCLAVHLMCVIATLIDPKNKGISKTLYYIIMLIGPVTSLFCGFAIYGYALFPSINIEKVTGILIGCFFILIGNYLPKCRQNYTVGIKLPWTLSSEDNWNHTHRLAGIVWIIGGAFFLISALLNRKGAWIFFIPMTIMIIVPIAYSLLYYFKHPEK